MNRNEIALAIFLQDPTKIYSSVEAFRLADDFIKQSKEGQETPEVLTNGWISVDDMPPPCDTDVLIYPQYDDRLIDRLPFWGDVTHWQPLPEPPHGVK